MLLPWKTLKKMLCALKKKHAPMQPHRTDSIIHAPRIRSAAISTADRLTNSSRPTDRLTHNLPTDRTTSRPTDRLTFPPTDSQPVDRPAHRPTHTPAISLVAPNSTYADPLALLMTCVSMTASPPVRAVAHRQGTEHSEHRHKRGTEQPLQSPTELRPPPLQGCNPAQNKPHGEFTRTGTCTRDGCGGSASAREHYGSSSCTRPGDKQLKTEETSKRRALRHRGERGGRLT